MTRHDPHIISVVRRMKGERARDAEIAMAVGMSEDSLKWLCHKHGIKRPSARTINISAVVANRYRTEAVRRGVRLDRLLHRVLLTVAKENLFAAIIDDGK